MITPQPCTVTRFVVNSVTRLGDFWKFLAKSYLTKVAQTFNECLGVLNTNIFLCKNLLWLLIGNFCKQLGWLLFIPTSGQTGLVIKELANWPKLSNFVMLDERLKQNFTNLFMWDIEKVVLYLVKLSFEPTTIGLVGT